MNSKKDEVYGCIRKDIISGVIKQGEIINEGELAQKYGVSRTPVREALLKLAYEGFVTPLPRAGYLITQVSVRDVQEAFHLREILELEAVRLAAHHIAPADIERLETLKIGVPGSLNPTFNHEFHTTIARASGNRRLAELIGQLLDEMERMLIYDPHISSPPSSEEHDDIIQALSAGDADSAQGAMRRHLQLVKTRVLQRF